MVVVLVQMDSFRSTVVVTLSVNVMCTHLYYCSMRCLYCNMFAHITSYMHIPVGVFAYVCVLVLM